MKIALSIAERQCPAHQNLMHIAGAALQKASGTVSEQSERLRLARVSAGYSSASEAAEALGVPKGTYLGHENGSRQFSVDMAKKYGQKFGVHFAYLLGDNDLGPPTRETPGGDRVVIPIDEWDPANPGPDEQQQGHAFANVGAYQAKLPGARPEIDVRPGAGQGMIGGLEAVSISAAGSVTGHQVIDEWVLPAAFFRHELRAKQSTSIIMAVVGDSMAPTFGPGDRLIVDTSQNSLTADGIYVFDDGDGEPRVKRLQKVLRSSPPAVHIISDNAALKSQTLEIAEIRIIGRVVGRISRL